MDYRKMTSSRREEEEWKGGEKYGKKKWQQDPNTFAHIKLF